MKLLMFFIGFMIGSIAGIVTMCLVQANRYTKDLEVKNDGYKKTKS